MAYTPEVSGLVTLLGIGISWWIYIKTRNVELTYGILFFFGIELIQFIQHHFYANELEDYETCLSNVIGHTRDTPCDTYHNKILTLLAFVHFCFQPYFCHLINSSLISSCKYKDRLLIIKRLCLIGGFLLFFRYFLSFSPSLKRMDLWRQPSTEWMRGNILCTFKSQFMSHLAWSVPMADPSYFIVGVSIHSFLMYAPFVILYELDGMLMKGIILFLTGPFIASQLSKNPMEQASISTYLIITQIIIVLISLREKLFFTTTTATDANSLVVCKDFLNCQFCNEENRRRIISSKKKN